MSLSGQKQLCSFRILSTHEKQLWQAYSTIPHCEYWWQPQIHYKTKLTHILSSSQGKGD